MAWQFAHPELPLKTFSPIIIISLAFADEMMNKYINVIFLGDGTGGGLHTNYYDDFGTWTHYWGTWTGTGKFTGNEVTQFIHLNYGWNDEGKIIYHNIHIDGKDFWAEVNAAEAASGSE